MILSRSTLTMLLAVLLALALASAPASADPVLGRLFATPAERAALDAQRGVPAATPAGPGDAAPPIPPVPPNGMPPADADAAGSAPPAPETLKLSGVLRSSSGRSTVWLNDLPQRGVANKGKALTVTLPSGKRILLKPGQRYDLGDGRVKDVNE